METPGIVECVRSFAVAVALLSLAACSTPDTEQNKAAGAAVQEAAPAGTPAVPADFPFAICPSVTGLSVDTSPHPSTQEPQTQVAFTCPDSVDLVSRFYQYQLTMRGWETLGEVVKTSTGSQIISATKEQSHATINVAPDDQDPERTRVSVVIGPKRS